MSMEKWINSIVAQRKTLETASSLQSTSSVYSGDPEVFSKRMVSNDGSHEWQADFLIVLKYYVRT